MGGYRISVIAFQLAVEAATETQKKWIPKFTMRRNEHRAYIDLRLSSVKGVTSALIQHPNDLEIHKWSDRRQRAIGRAARFCTTKHDPSDSSTPSSVVRPSFPVIVLSRPASPGSQGSIRSVMRPPSSQNIQSIMRPSSQGSIRSSVRPPSSQSRVRPSSQGSSTSQGSCAKLYPLRTTSIPRLGVFLSDGFEEASH